jgi:hypothetical protein
MMIIGRLEPSLEIPSKLREIYGHLAGSLIDAYPKQRPTKSEGPFFEHSCSRGKCPVRGRRPRASVAQRRGSTDTSISRVARRMCLAGRHLRNQGAKDIGILLGLDSRCPVREGSVRDI